MKVKGEIGPCGGSSHQNHTHGVGVTGAGTPASQDDDDIALLEEASDLAWKLNQKYFQNATFNLISSVETSCTDPVVAVQEPAHTRTHFHGKVNAHVNVLCPHIIGWFSVQDRKDAAVQVGLACRLGVTGHGEDGSTGPVPGDQVCGPADIQTAVNVKEKLVKIISSLLNYLQLCKCGQD